MISTVMIRPMASWLKSHRGDWFHRTKLKMKAVRCAVIFVFHSSSDNYLVVWWRVDRTRTMLKGIDVDHSMIHHLNTIVVVPPLKIVNDQILFLFSSSLDLHVARRTKRRRLPTLFDTLRRKRPEVEASVSFSFRRSIDFNE